MILEQAGPIYAEVSNTIKEKVGKSAVPANKLNWLL